MKLYGHEESGHAYKVALALTLSQIPYEYERVDINQPCETRAKNFRENSRWCEVPLLMVNDQALTQSGAILQYLARNYDALGGMENYEIASEWIMWEANRIGMCLPQLIYAQKRPAEVNSGAVKWLNSRLEIDRKRLDHALQFSPFLTGQKASIGDIAVFGYVYHGQNFGIEFTPNIYAWIDRICNLPYFQTPESLLAS